MELHPSPMEQITSLYLAKIVAYQEEIIKMLSEIMVKETDLDSTLLYKERIQEAKKKVPDLVNDFLNRLRVEAKNQVPPR